MLTRRLLLKDAATIVGGAAVASSLRGFADEPSVVILTPSMGKLIAVPANFVGLGYEMSSVATAGLLSASNDRYVRLVKGLGSNGVIRVGGIVADYTRYVPTGAAIAEPKNTVITRERLEQFGGFLHKVGWSAIWSVNFAQGTVEDAVMEVREVASVLGSRLLAVELGNEVENYSRGERPFRGTSYTYENYRAEYDRWHGAIVEAVPGVNFAAPDTAASVEWVERMALDAKGDVQLLTTHYYRGGEKDGTAAQLLQPDPHLKEVLERLSAASKMSAIPWRMCETNSFFGGGKAGLSDTFLGALWTLDYMLLLASYGCAGVNIETGVNQLGFVSHYSPILDDGKGTNRAGAPYYGMLAFAIARKGCTGMMPVAVSDSAKGITAYLLGASGKVRCAVLINRGGEDVTVSIAGLGLRRAWTMRLVAPDISSVTGITFAGASVGEDGVLAGNQVDRVEGMRVLLPKMSAAVVRDDVGAALLGI